LKRHMLDLLEFLLESDRRIALWSESVPMLWVETLKEGKIVGEVKI